MPAQTEAAGRSILIVDDQSSNVRLLEHTLRRAGFSEVMSTTEPRNVTTMHAENDYDVILLDLQMPAMNGMEVLAALQKIRTAHPVVILVLSADATRTDAALAEGADSFLAKPFRLPDVVERIEMMLKGRAQAVEA